jgi:hypothetical protein
MSTFTHFERLCHVHARLCACISSAADTVANRRFTLRSVQNRDREKPRGSPLPHHLAYGSVPRRFGAVTCSGEHLIGLTPSDQRIDY